MNSGLDSKRTFSRVVNTKYDICLIRNFTSVATISPSDKSTFRITDAPLEAVEYRRRESKETMCFV
jgi:hypothetical protein